MDVQATAAAFLEDETRALVTRVGRIRPFVLQETLVPAAGLAPPAQTAIERLLISTRRELLAEAAAYIRWLRGPGRRAAPAEMQRRFVTVRLRFSDVVSQFDTFADAITQRSETESGVWLSGLDVVAADGLALPGGWYEPPPVICYLDRGPGAAIRRARTRLPGGRPNPVAIIRVPRERMVSGTGIASSVLHEVGHQAAALLELVPSLQTELRWRAAGPRGAVYGVWSRWISEMVADLFAIARVGIASTLGLIAVVSLPRPFVFRVDLTDPHPSPWLRVAVSAALGDALYPDPQWRAIAELWRRWYPLERLPDGEQRLLSALHASIPRLVGALLGHRPRTLRGATLGAALRGSDRTPARLRALAADWTRGGAAAYRAPPSLAFAVIGQARADRRIDPGAESRVVAQLLTHWALRSTLDISALSAGAVPGVGLARRPSRRRVLAPAA